MFARLVRALPAPDCPVRPASVTRPREPRPPAAVGDVSADTAQAPRARVRPTVLGRLRRVWPDWASGLVVVRHATVIEWHRRGFGSYRTRRSRQTPGRPPIDAAPPRHLRPTGDPNPPWGPPAIHRGPPEPG